MPMNTCFFTILICFLFLPFITIAGNNGDSLIFEISRPILNGLDDVEERTNNSIYTGSTDIELIHDYDDGDQLVGLRFQNLPIPQGAEIIESYIQFTSDEETSTGVCDLNIWAEASDNPAPFEALDFNISNRERTNAQINWQPPNWNFTGQTTAAQATPNLSEIVQEVVDRSGWQSGNSMTFIIEGEGRRVAAAFELNQSQAARLEIKFVLPSPTEVYQQVFINEVMPANGIFEDEFGEKDDWLEIYNGSDEAIFMGGLYLTDDLNDLKKWKIVAPGLIQANSFGMIWADGQTEQGGLHANFKLKSEGEFLAISQALNGEMHLLDAIEYPATPLNVSYGREMDGQTPWVFFGAYSPNASNNDRLQYLDETVLFSKPGGLYNSFFTVSMSVSDPIAQIYYTLDGSDPNMDDLLYSSPILVNETSLLRARAFKANYIGGKITTETYLINEPDDLPILSVQSEPENFWDDENGIYVSGTNGATGYCSNTPYNWNQDWERPGSITFFEADGTKGFQVNVGIKVGGGCSRLLKMKGLNFFCRNGQYGDESIEYQVFPDLDVHEFRRLKIRNSGNDFEQMMFRDGINQSLLYETVDIDLMAYRPVKVFLNGEYWGIYGLREFFNQDYVASHHGSDPDNLDIIANPHVFWNEVKEGDFEAFQFLVDYVQFNDLQNANNYSVVQQLLDVNEYLNYHISQIYLANYDWPANNVRVWRDRADGKFRWMLFDTDATTNYGWWSESNATDNTLEHALNEVGDPWPNGPQSTLLLRNLMENEGFKNEFVQRTCTFRELIFHPSRVHPMVDSLRFIIEPAMQRHINRWLPNFPNFGNGTPSGGSMSNWYSYIDNYKSFFGDRRNFIINHYRTELSLSDVFYLSFNYDKNTKGSLFIHQNEMAIPFNYQGEYFKFIPIKIKAVAKSGYRFSHWLETGETNPEIDFIASSHSTITPIFAPNHPIITEINYHPKEDEDLEFIEWFNQNNFEVDMSGIQFTQGIVFEFPEATVLAPEEYVLVVKDKSKFESLSCRVFEWESGDLNNMGETIEVVDNQSNIIQSISYQNADGWPAEANGLGASLSLKTPQSDNTLAENWEASFVSNGTPCGEQLPDEEEDPIEFLLNIFPNPATTDLFINYASINESPLELEFFNALGQLVFQIELSPSPFLQEANISIKDWASGVYFVNLKSEEKGKWIEKIVVK